MYIRNAMTSVVSTQEPTTLFQSSTSNTMEPPTQYQMGSNLDHLIFDPVQPDLLSEYLLTCFGLDFFSSVQDSASTESPAAIVERTEYRAYQSSESSQQWRQCCCDRPPESLQLHPGGVQECRGSDQRRMQAKWQEKSEEENQEESSRSSKSRHHRGPEGFNFCSISRFSSQVSRWYSPVICEIGA